MSPGRAIAIVQGLADGEDRYSADYAYDLAGNRTQSVINGVTNTYTLGLGNRLAAWGVVNAENAQTYDSAGNVTQITDASGTRDLSWDIQYRLTHVAVDGNPVETYGYDPLGRRAWTSDGSVTNWHVHDGMHVVADLDVSGAVLRSYTWGPGIDNLLAMTVHGSTDTNTYIAITDHLGTVHGLADDTGVLVESYRFDAWGNVLGVFDGTGQPISGSAIGNRYLFQGREYSWATGLYNFRARWYDPITSRWLSKDPIGISGGLNQYVAFGNNPVMFVDPFGLDAMHGIAGRAFDYDQSTRWNFRRNHYLIRRWVPKCNIFVYDVLTEEGFSVPLMTEHNGRLLPPLARDWAHPDSEHIPGFEIIPNFIPGAIGSFDGHVGIVAPDGVSTVSVIDGGPVGINDWGFREHQRERIVWRAPIREGRPTVQRTPGIFHNGEYDDK